MAGVSRTEDLLENEVKVTVAVRRRDTGRSVDLLLRLGFQAWERNDRGILDAGPTRVRVRVVDPAQG